MKQIWTGFLCLALFACATTVNVINYTPDLSNIEDPISTIKNTLEQQPPAYAYVPVKVEVTDQMMAVYMLESGLFKLGTSIVPTVFYYKTLGDPRLSRSTRANFIWNIEIFDKYGNSLYWVFTDSEKQAKDFVDALVYMIRSKT